MSRMNRILLLACLSLSGCFYTETLADGGVVDCMFSCQEAGLTCGEVFVCGHAISCGEPCRASDGGTQRLPDGGNFSDAGSSALDAGAGFVDGGLSESGDAGPANDGGHASRRDGGGAAPSDAGSASNDAGATIGDAGPATTDAGPFGDSAVVTGSDLRYLDITHNTTTSCTRVRLQSQFGTTPPGLSVVGGTWAGGNAEYAEARCDVLVSPAAFSGATGVIAINSSTTPTVVGLTSLAARFDLSDGGQVTVHYADGELAVQY